MIKILFFIETLEGGGAEKVLRNLVNNMDQSRFEITVQTVWPCESANYLAPGIRYKSMYPKQNRVNELRYRMEAESGIAYQLHFRDDYDIECAYLEMGTTKLMAASNNKKAKKIAWVHCDLKKAVQDTTAFVQKAAKWYQKFDQIVCVSENVKDSFEDLFGAYPPARVIHNVIDEEEILEKAEAPCEASKQSLTAISIGRMTGQKGYDRLLRAKKQLQDRGVQCDLWLLGEGPDQMQLKNMAISLGLSDSVKFMGFQKNPYPYLKAADFFICSSRYEGMSTSVIESLILEKPVITTDCTGMQELLGDSEFGLIVPNTEEGLTEGFLRMASEEKLREHYRLKAADRKKQFSKAYNTEVTQQFFETLLS